MGVIQTYQRYGQNLLAEDNIQKHLNRTVDDLRSVYTSGCCGILAEALRRRLGWNVYGVYWARNGRELQSDLIHVVVCNPETRLYADAYGFERPSYVICDKYMGIRDNYMADSPILGVVLRRIYGPTPYQDRQLTVENCLRYDLHRLFPDRFPAPVGS